MRRAKIVEVLPGMRFIDTRIGCRSNGQLYEVLRAHETFSNEWWARNLVHGTWAFKSRFILANIVDKTDGHTNT